MGSIRTIQHPGVEIHEYDLSQYSPETAGTTTFILGYAAKGTDCQIQPITTKNQFLEIYGTPANEAERYLYNAMSEVVSQAGDCLIAKLPYDNTSRNIYGVNTYTVATSTTLSNAITSNAYNATDFTGYNAAHIISDPTFSSTNMSAIDDWRTGNSKPSTNQFVIIDKTRSIIGKNILASSNNETIGFFPVITTALNALPYQNMLTMSGFNSTDCTNWMAVSAIRTVAVPLLDSTQFAMSLATSSIYDNTLSKALANKFPAITYNDAGTLDSENMNKIMVNVITMKNDPGSNNRISFTPIESFIGSLNKNSKDINGNSDYIGNIINSNSNYIEFYGNITDTGLALSGQTYSATTQKSSIYGFTEAETAKLITTTTLLSSIDVIFDRASNIDEYVIDLVTDAGVSNIAQYIDDSNVTSGYAYDPDGVTNLTWKDTVWDKSNTTTWKQVINKYINFCSTTRKDCMAIVDGLRPLVLAGNQKIVRPGVTATIDNNILTYLKNITGLNSNYAAMYINWFKVVDTFTGVNYWLPPSIMANSAYVYTDRTANYWDAPAGLNRGVVYNAIDIAFNPNGKQQDAIYTKSFNYAVNYPSNGIVIEGQKTLQVKQSAFDRVNVRRLFLKLERLTYNIAKTYVYEPNNVFTRTRLLDQLTPVYEDAKSRGGVYDYKLVCDSSNNSVSSIDNNELRLAVLIKPTKTAEYIVCDFYALSTGMSFSEVAI
jgi:hypothetical protein